jgi:hypothetical protein
MSLSLRLGLGLGLFTPSGVDDEMAWTRPADWLAMPATAANQIDILTAVTDTDSNYVALSATVSAGTYNVDWGDGSVSTGVTSGTNAEHKYDFADADLDGTLSSRGYKQALIKITPNTGGATFTAFDLGKKHSSSLQSVSFPAGSLASVTNLRADAGRVTANVCHLPSAKGFRPAGFLKNLKGLNRQWKSA